MTRRLRKGVLPYAPAFQAASALVAALVAILLTATLATASPYRHELSASFLGGSGLGASLDYGYNLNRHLGLRLGVGYWTQGYDSEATITGSMPENDGFENINLLYTLSGYKETWTLHEILVPVAVRGSVGLFYGELGVALLIPVSSERKAEAGLSIQGQYPSQDRILDDPILGFGDMGAQEATDSDTSANRAILGTVELGVEYPVRENLKVSLGVFGRIGFNKTGETESNIIAYDPTATPTATLTKPQGAAERPLEFGARLRVSFDLGSLIAPPIDTLALQKRAADSLAAAAEAAEKKRMADSLAAQKILLAMQKKTADSLAAVEQALLLAQQKKTADSLEALNAWRTSYIAAMRAQNEADKAVKKSPKNKKRSSKGKYEIDNADLNPVIQEELDREAALMRQNPKMRIRIVGHTCDLGDPTHNLELGLKRAQNAWNYLVTKHQIDSGRISIESRGSSDPIVPNDTEENRQINRRVELFETE
jgi:outer membrane protein OmpA-like peptidoglycan-associated protein